MKAVKIILLTSFLMLGVIFCGLAYMTNMPGISYVGTPSTCNLLLESSLRKHINKLATEIGPRNDDHLDNLNKAADYIENEFKVLGIFNRRIKYTAEEKNFFNIEALIPGASDGTLILGAHYDSDNSTPGANDNASGVASIIEIARFLTLHKPQYAVRLVAFPNEEANFFGTAGMGSLQYASMIKKEEGGKLAMFSLETLGYYSNKPGTQKYPFPFNFIYPDKGNFIAFVTNLYSRDLLMYSIELFRQASRFPSEGVASPGFIPGIAWSDHWAFWMRGIPAVMITDTAPFRYPAYHKASDTADQIDYKSLCLVVQDLSTFFQNFSFAIEK